MTKNENVTDRIAENSKNLYCSNILTYPYLLIITVCVLIGSGYIAHYRALWYDEFFTYYIAQLPNLTQILGAFLDGASNNAPLDFMIRHLFMQVAGTSPLSLRLPSLVMFIIGGLFLYRYVSFRIPSLPATVAFCFPVLTLALHYSYEGRYYALFLASSAMSLYFWQQCVHKKYRINYLFLLFLSLSFGCYIHFYGVFTFIPITLGEIVRLYKAKAKVYRILAAIVLAAASTVFLYPFIVNSARYKDTYFAAPYVSAPFTVYDSLLPSFGLAVAVFLIVVAPLILYWQKTRVASYSPEDQEIPIHEIVAAVAFSLLPFAIWIAAITVTNAYWPSYCIVAISGLSILAAYMCNVIGKRQHVVGIILVTCVMLLGAYTVAKRVANYSDHEPRIAEKLVDFVESSELPIVVSHGHQYLYYDHYLPKEMRSKVAFVLDRKLSIKYLGEDTDDMSLIDLNKVRRFNLQPWRKFTKNNREYYVLTRDFNDGWPIQKIREDFQNKKLDLELIYFSEKAKVVKVRYK